MKSFLLDCKHSVRFESPYPSIGDRIYCIRCRVDVRVMAQLSEFSIRCATCNYSRRFGADSREASRIASRHAVARQHVVKIMCNSTSITEVSHRDFAVTLDDAAANGQREESHSIDTL